MTVATASAGAMSVRTRVRGAAKGAISAVKGRSVKIATRAPSAHSQNKGRRVTGDPRGRIARKGPIHGSSAHRNTDARLHPARARLIRAKVIMSASAAAVVAATVANGVNAVGLHRRRRGARKSALHPYPP